ncbi:hypothetical protein V1478_003080 [Vespula squamosa]|uniref:Uncharacterized protein n=1 Tax=Vespula squamosa TaxID=30214 RepID=A0ABD2BRN9_VESSQ
MAFEWLITITSLAMLPDYEEGSLRCCWFADKPDLCLKRSSPDYDRYPDIRNYCTTTWGFMKKNGKVRETLLGGKGSCVTDVGNRITMLSNQKDNRYGEIEVEKWKSRMIADFKENSIPSGIMTTITFSRLDARSFALLEKLLLDLSGFCETSLPVLRGFVEDKRVRKMSKLLTEQDESHFEEGKRRKRGRNCKVSRVRRTNLRTACTKLRGNASRLMGPASQGSRSDIS